MTYKHYDVVKAGSPSDLADMLEKKIAAGWQPYGSPVAVTPYILIQAIAAEGDVTDEPDTGGTGTDDPSGGDTGDTGQEADITLTVAAGTPEDQGWTVEGTTIATTANTVTSESETLAENVFSIIRQDSTLWRLDHTAIGCSDLLTNGGEFFIRFRITDESAVASQYAIGIYLIPSQVPDGVTFNKTGDGLSPALLNLYVQTDSSGNMNLCMHCATKSAENLTLTTIGEFDNNWHSIRLVYNGGTTSRCALYIDGQEEGSLTLTCAPSTIVNSDILDMSGISTKGYNIEVESMTLTVNDAAA